MIDKCRFGSMTIAGKQYTTDLMIFPDGQVKDQWWRDEGHRFTAEDIMPLVETEPDIIVAGIGIYGRVNLDSQLSELLEDRQITLIAEPTEEAARAFNKARESSDRVAGCFHLTC